MSTIFNDDPELQEIRARLDSADGAVRRIALLDLADSDATVRREAVAVLGYLKRTDALAPLTIVAAHDPEPEARRAALGAQFCRG